MNVFELLSIVFLLGTIVNLYLYIKKERPEFTESLWLYLTAAICTVAVHIIGVWLLFLLMEIGPIKIF